MILQAAHFHNPRSSCLPPLTHTPHLARAPARLCQVFSRIRQHAERTKRDHYSGADLLDFLGTSFKVGGAGD